MKITKRQLKRIIREEMAALYEQGYTPGEEDQTMMSDEDIEAIRSPARPGPTAAQRRAAAAQRRAAWHAKLKKSGVSGDELRRQAHAAKEGGVAGAADCAAAAAVPGLEYLCDYGPDLPGHDDRRRDRRLPALANMVKTAVEKYSGRGPGKTKTISTPQGDIEVPVVPGESKESFQQRVKQMIKAHAMAPAAKPAADPRVAERPLTYKPSWWAPGPREVRGMEEGKITKRTLRRLVETVVLNTLKD